MSIKKGNKIIAGAPLEPVWGNIVGNLQDQEDLRQALSEKAGKVSPTFSGTPIAPTAPTDTRNNQIATTEFVQNAIEGAGSELPDQYGHAGQYLTTNGTLVSWAKVDALPSQTSQSGKFLTTNGTTASWANIPTEIPSQSGQSGKYLTTNGTTVSWSTVDALPSQTSQSGKYLTTNGTTANWSDISYKSLTDTPVGGTDIEILHYPEGLPSGYTWLRYIEGNGQTEYIDTGIKVSTLVSPKIVTRFQMISAGDLDWFGTSSNSSPTIIYDIVSGAGNTGQYIRWGTTGYTRFSGTSSALNFYDTFHTLEIGGNDVTAANPVLVDGVQVGTLAVDSTAVISSTSNILIFRARTNAGISKFMSFTIYSNGSQVFNGIPAKRNSDNAIGMYDTVSNTFKTSAGSGTFTSGGEIQDSIINFTNETGYATKLYTDTQLSYKQATLVSGTNIKTINNNSILGSGNLEIDSLPSQSGNNGKFLTTNGTTASWATVDAFPTQAGNANKFLTTDGNNVSWATVDALPSQSGQSGKYLTTNGTAASWASLPTYSSGTGISVSGTTINHSNSVTAGTAGTSSATSGSSLAVPYVTYDAQGHITASGTHTHTVTGFLTSNDIDQTYSGTSTNAQSGVAVKSAIDAAVASVYKPAGSVAFANKPTLSSSIEGNVYNITDAFTTTSDFVEGTGHSYPAGTNIVCINTAESGQTAVYKWDVLAGFVDLSGYVTKDGGSAQQTIQLTSGTGTTAFGVKSRSTSSYISFSGTGGWLGSYGVTSDKTPTFYNGTSYTLAYVENTVASNTAITGATKCKITYDSKGLVTAGADLTASDIPNLSLSKITDVTASATELNYVDGVTSNVQTQLDNKPDFTDYGLIVPDTSKMDVLKTITYTVSANSVYRFGNFSNNISNLWDIKGDAIFRITVTGTNINQQIEGIISMRQALDSPFIVIRNRRGNSLAATSGIRYIYSRYPKALNSGYNWQFDFACYDATERTIKIEILKNDIGFSWEESLTSSTYDSTYQSSATLTAYTTDGIIGIPTLNWAASSASTAGYLTSYLPKMIAGTQPLAGAALLASQLCFMSSNKMYPSTSKTLPIDTGYGICFNSTATSSGSATAYNYLRQKVSATSLTNIPHATLARGNSCYFRCTMDANGNILSDNYVAASMAAGYTWYYIGIAQSSSAINIDTTNSVFLTLDSNGSLTHINGKKITTTDLSNYQTKITSSAKLSADLISDGTTNKIVTATEKSTWSGKQDALVSGTNIKTINNQSILGNGNIDIQGGTTVEAYTASEVQTIWDSVTPT